LNCLRAKLKDRYGDDDEAVLQVEMAVHALEDIEARYRELPTLPSSRPGPATGRFREDTPR
jgi:hypothetical protein